MTNGKSRSSRASPLGAHKARARQSNGTFSRGSTDAVVTADFFVIHAAAPVNVLARCADCAVADAMRPEDTEGWQPC